MTHVLKFPLVLHVLPLFMATRRTHGNIDPCTVKHMSFKINVTKS